MFHICQDEIVAFLHCLPFARHFVAWLRHCATVWRTRHTDHCTHEHKHKHNAHRAMK